MPLSTNRPSIREAPKGVPPEVIQRLEAQGLAIVPVRMTAAQKGRRYLNLHRSQEDRYEAVIEEGRIRA